MKVVFLDRDGTLNDCPLDDYVKSAAGLRLYPYAVDSVRRMNEAGFEVIVISNQAGVAKGIYTLKNLDEITRRISLQMERAGASILDFFYCPHRDEDECLCRKPLPGLLKMAVRKYPSIDFQSSFLVGDSLKDMQLAAVGGLRSILVLTGHGENARLEAAQLVPPPLAVVANLAEAVSAILKFA